MHGKIKYYSSKAGVGTILDNLKKGYDFKISAWHDTSTIPSVGMYIVYTLDDKDRISDIKSSKYQSFKNNPFLNEADFWATVDDVQLEELEEKRREELVNTRVKELEDVSIESIEETKSAAECIRYVFARHYEMLDENSELMSKNVAFEFDYAVLKRFLEKTLLQLTTLDKRISADEFIEPKQKIIKVEYLLGLLAKIADPDNITLTKESYLHFQIEYLAIRRFYGNIKDGVAMYSNKIKTLETEITNLPAKIKATQDKDENARLKGLLDKKIAEKTEIETELSVKMPIQDSLKVLLQDFEKKSVGEFPDIYRDAKDNLRRDLLKLLNRLADDLDTRLYQKAATSEVVISNFYANNIDSTFSTMTFVKYYISRLNKDLMQDADKRLYEYYLKYQKAVNIKFAIITSDLNMGQDLKVMMLSQEKHARAMLFSRAVEFFSVCDSESFSMIFVDTSLRGSDYLELIQKGKSSLKNSDATYVVFDS